jgi:hypothetical protein
MREQFGLPCAERLISFNINGTGEDQQESYREDGHEAQVSIENCCGQCSAENCNDARAVSVGLFHTTRGSQSRLHGRGGRDE